MFFSGVLLVIILACSCASLHQVPVVVPVNAEAAEVYECVHGDDPENANVSWYRKDWPSLPEEIKVEGNKLHFMHTSSNLNGMYSCVVINKKGTFVAYFYREIQDCLLNRILKWVSELWKLLTLASP
ncbi:hypothetical protein Q7C36_008543 [Tachysurus vachellii]|uniref:Ig-like domain-containing protein n=1 Tax=Tachysurus vachellii TaxID=175792 RepID=A0AA88N1S9_TACVA|nr:hypothetical protein Q7C36_008543 [Tachysurus vachellii]